MASFDDVAARYRIDRVELTAWIEQRWVRPRQTTAGFEFDEVDIARVSLIRELQRDVVTEADSLEVVLSLLDQLYAARRVLHTLDDAIAALPEAMREEVAARLRRPVEPQR